MASGADCRKLKAPSLIDIAVLNVQKLYFVMISHFPQFLVVFIVNRHFDSLFAPFFTFILFPLNILWLCKFFLASIPQFICRHFFCIKSVPLKWNRLLGLAWERTLRSEKHIMAKGIYVNKETTHFLSLGILSCRFSALWICSYRAGWHAIVESHCGSWEMEKRWQSLRKLSDLLSNET